MLEIHFLELKKLEEGHSEDEEDPARAWLQFLNAHSKGEMEMIAEKDDHIKKAYKVLQVASMDEAKRLAYEAREAELMDQRTREEDARAQGIQQGIQQAKLESAKAFLDIADDETIAKKLGLPIETVKGLRGL